MDTLEVLKTVLWSNYNFRVRPDTDLQHLFKRIEEQIFLELNNDLTQDELKCTVIDKLVTYFRTTEEGQRDFAALESYGLKLGDMFLNALNTLKGKVADEVGSLSEQILATAEEYSTRRLQMSNTDGQFTQVEGSFTVLKLGDLSNVAEERLKDFIKKFQLRVDSFNLVSAKFFINSVRDIVPIGGEIGSTLIADLNKTFTDSNTTVMHSDLEQLSATLTDLHKYTQLKSYLFGSGVGQNKLVASELVACINYVKVFPEFEKLFKSADLNISDELKTEVDKNFENLQHFYTLACCTLELARQKFKDVLVIGPNLINGDQIEDFRKAGGTLTDIQNYLRLYFNQNEDDVLYSQVYHQSFPLGGIKSNDILTKFVADRTKIISLMDSVRVQMSSIKQTCTRDAFVNTLKKYVIDIHAAAIGATESASAILPTGMNPDQFVHSTNQQITQLANVFSRNDQANIEDMVYNFYLHTWMKDTLVSTIYYQLGAEALSKLSESTVNDPLLINRINAAVMSDILTAYLSKTFLVAPN